VASGAHGSGDAIGLRGMARKNTATDRFDGIANRIAQLTETDDMITIKLHLPELAHLYREVAAANGFSTDRIDAFANGAVQVFRRNIWSGVVKAIGGWAEIAYQVPPTMLEHRIPKELRDWLKARVNVRTRAALAVPIGGNRWTIPPLAEFFALVDELQPVYVIAKRLYREDRERFAALIKSSPEAKALNPGTVGLVTQFVLKNRNLQPQQLAAQHAYEQLKLADAGKRVPSAETLLRRYRKYRRSK
jgi:hypothetical protein